MILSEKKEIKHLIAFFKIRKLKISQKKKVMVFVK